MTMLTIRGRTIDRADVISARGGNRVIPGLAAFTGLSFLVYLLVKIGAGTLPLGVSAFAQIVVSAALLGWGGGLLVKGRYFHVTLETRGGPIRFNGLTKGEQTEILALFDQTGAPRS
ncbi:MAG: hypothetical protein ACK4WC_16295 [Rubrimonas sp.]